MVDYATSNKNRLPGDYLTKQIQHVSTESRISLVFLTTLSFPSSSAFCFLYIFLPKAPLCTLCFKLCSTIVVMIPKISKQHCENVVEIDKFVCISAAHLTLLDQNQNHRRRTGGELDRTTGASLPEHGSQQQQVDRVVVFFFSFTGAAAVTALTVAVVTVDAAVAALTVLNIAAVVAASVTVLTVAAASAGTAVIVTPSLHRRVKRAAV